jgi:HPt (histidine-containing phosphotransfer) domain-containing protein
MTTEIFNETLRNSQPVLKKNHLSEILGSNEASLLIDFYKLFLEQLEQLRVDLLSYTEPYDHLLISHTAHKLKSSALSIGAFLMADILNLIEETAKYNPRETLNKQLQELSEIRAVTESRIQREIATLSSLADINT